MTNRFGARLFQIFFKSYSEKLWGISCRELDADFAAQRIKKFSLFEAIRTALVGSGGQSKHKTPWMNLRIRTRGRVLSINAWRKGSLPWAVRSSSRPRSPRSGHEKSQS